MATENRRPGLLRLVGADAVPNAAYDTSGTPLPSTGAAHLWDQARSGLAEIGATISHSLDQAAASEGRVQGRLAGLDPEFRPTHSGTIRGRAFDEAGLQVAETSAKTAMSADMARAHDQFRNDPVALDRELGRIGTAYQSKALPETLPAVKLEADHARLGYMRDASRIQIQQTEHGQIAAFHQETAAAVARIHQRAFQLGLDPQSDGVMAADLDQLRAALSRKGVNGLPLATPEQQQKTLEHAAVSVSNARALGAFDRLGSVAEKEAFLANLDDTFKKGEGFAKVYTFEQYDSLKRHLRAELRASKAHDAVLGEGLAADIASIETRGKQGIMVSPEEIAGLRTRAIASGHGDKLGLIDQAERTAGILRDARRYAPEDIEKMAGEWKARINARAAAGGALEFIKREEGSKDNGWDYRQYSGPYGVKRGANERLTLAQAEERLGREVGAVQAEIDARIKVPLTDGQRTALSSLFYNIGTGKGRLDQVAAMINAGRLDEVPGFIRQFTRNADGGYMQGLADRREREAALFAGKTTRGDLVAGKQDFAVARDEAKVVSSLEGLAAHARTELSRDQLGWASQTGLVQVAPLDLSSPAAGIASMRSRIVAAEVAGGAFGRDAVYLRPDEKRQLALSLQNGGTQALETLGMLSTGFGRRMPQIAAELQKDGHAPVTALLAGLVAEVGTDARAVRDAADGLALMKQKDHEHLAPKGTDTRPQVVDVLGSSFGRTGRDEGAVVALANAIYVQRAIQSGNKGAFDPDAYRQALREAVGERTIEGTVYGGVVAQSGWWNGHHQIVLPPNLSKKNWRSAIDMITADDLKAAGIADPVGDDGKPVSLARVKAGILIQYGTGQYVVATGDPSKPGQEGIVQAGEKGRPLVLDFAKLAPILAKRRKDLFHGVN